MKFGESGLQIITALIGSSLLIPIITILIGDFNRANVSIDVKPHINISKINSTSSITDIENPLIEYYEIIIKNIGRTPASNLTLSMYFNGPIIKNYTVLGTENLKFGNPIIRETNPCCYLSAYAPKLAPNDLLIIYLYTNTTERDPYYISATYEQGSNQYPNFSPVDIESGDFPDIANDATLVEQVLVISIILCGLFFSVAIIHKRVKRIIHHDKDNKLKIEFDLALAIPLIALSAIFILYFLENLPRTFIFPYLIPIPLDVTTGTSLGSDVYYNGVQYKQGELVLDAFVFLITSFLARGLVAYFISKYLLIKLKENGSKSDNNKNPLADTNASLSIPKIDLLLFSFLIMGLPISSSLVLFFSKSLYGISPFSFFVMFVAVDVVRMLILILIVPKIMLKTNKMYYYILTVATILSSISQFILFIMINKLSRQENIITNSFFELTSIPLIPSIQNFILVAGLLCLVRVILPIIAEIKYGTDKKRKDKYYVLHIVAAIFSFLLVLIWSYYIHTITTFQDPILKLGLPIILTGISTILIEGTYAGISLIIVRHHKRGRKVS